MGPVDVEPLALAVRPTVAASGITLVPVQAQPAESTNDTSDVFVGRAFRVRIVDTQNEHTVGLAGKEVIVECRAGIADVEIAGGAGRNAHTDRACHDCFSNPLPLLVEFARKPISQRQPLFDSSAGLLAVRLLASAFESQYYARRSLAAAHIPIWQVTVAQCPCSGYSGGENIWSEIVAERVGFEPTRRWWRLLALQASAFVHLATSPQRLREKRVV